MNMPSSPSSGPAPDTAPTRRRALYALVAAAAGASGVGWAWWKLQPHSAAPGVEQALWQERFQTPDGAELTMQSFQGRPLLVNFWATWCPPCVRELPMLDAFSARQNQHGIQVIGLAVDKPEAVQRFLGRTPLRFPVALAVEGGLGLTRSLGNLQGGLPFTVLLGEDGMVQQRKIGELTTEDLASWSAKG